MPNTPNSTATETPDAPEPINATVYDLIENGGNVYADLADLDLDQMTDYFGDLDPTDFL